MIFNCPGSKQFRQPQPEIINCPYCSKELEIWTDEVKATCPHCKKAIMRQEGASCLDWCRYAKECVGDELYHKYLQNKAITTKEKLIKELEAHFKDDTKRINHAKNVMKFAEELLMKEKGDWHIVIPASILHDIGIKEAETKYGSSAGHYQEKESSLIARKILLKLGLRKDDIDEICEIIAHHHTPGKIDTQNFKILYDSDRLVNLKEEMDLNDKEKVARVIDKVFLTKTGKEIGRKVYL